MSKFPLVLPPAKRLPFPKLPVCYSTSSSSPSTSRSASSDRTSLTDDEDLYKHAGFAGADDVLWFGAELPVRTTRKQLHDELERHLILNKVVGWSDASSRPNQVAKCTWQTATRCPAGTVARTKTHVDSPTSDDPPRLKHETYELVYGRVNTPEPVSVIVRPEGHSIFYLDGVPHGEDVYRFGTMEIPVYLSKGYHEFLFLVVYPPFNVSFARPIQEGELQLRTHCRETDVIVPDVLIGQSKTYWASMTVLSSSWVVQAHIIEAALDNGPVTITKLSLSSLPKAHGFARLSFQFLVDWDTVKKPADKLFLNVILRSTKPKVVVDIARILIRQVPKTDSRKCTFKSNVDDSVQEYSILPAFQTALGFAPALFLSCHGAGVEVTGQTGAYAQKSWGHVVAPSNRGKYGFDWEDVGLLDALEVLDDVKKTVNYDPSRVYLTGHSMGGHGTWHIGSTRPSLFAAIAPCAGWASYETYAVAQHEIPLPVEFRGVLERANSLGNPRLLVTNLASLGVFVSHGGADEVVKTNQAKLMLADLAKSGHKDVRYVEDPEVGHWYTDSFDDGGARCLDKADLFDFFARRARPLVNTPLKIDFTTLCPSYSSVSDWACIFTQQQSMLPSRIVCELYPNKRHLQITATNCKILQLNLLALLGKGSLSLSINDQTYMCNIDYDLFLLERDNEWVPMNSRPSGLLKTPHRSGPVKAEVRNRFICVFPTRGSPEEVKWAIAKAKLDREQLFYRGRATVPLIADVDFLVCSPERYRDRTLLLYGNATINCAWNVEVEKSCPIQVNRNKLCFGGRTIETGSSAGALLLYPRVSSDIASCILIAATGPVGMRMMFRQPLFQPFVRYPDYTILEANSTGRDTPFEMKAAGFFDSEWRLPHDAVCNF